MPLLIPLVSHGITLTEIPDRVALYLELGDCRNDCRGCHSPHLRRPVPRPTPLDEIEPLIESAVSKGANAIVVLGGTTNGIKDADLIPILKRLGTFLPVCLYSGRDDEERDITLAKSAHCAWLKTGSYQESLGGLASPRTNQRFYALEDKYIFDKFGMYLRTETTLHDRTKTFREKGAT